MNILHYIALGAAAVNVVKKVLGKRNLVQNIYSDRGISVDGWKLYNKYGINVKKMYLAFDLGNDNCLYSFCEIYVPQVKVDGLNYWIFLTTGASRDILKETYSTRRTSLLGAHTTLFLTEDIPAKVMEKARRKGCMRIKPQYSVFKLAAKVGGIAPLKVILNDILIYMYRKCIIDGVIPRDCVRGLE